jgi:PAS domain S-box-containing protein
MTILASLLRGWVPVWPGLLGSLFFLEGRALAGDRVPPPGLIQTAAEVRELSPAEAGRHHPVKLRGVVTFFDWVLYCQFMQDETAGIYLEQTNLPNLVPGQEVEVTGVTSAGEFAPVVTPLSVRTTGPGVWPEARQVSVGQLTTGEEDSQRVELQGIVRSVTFDPLTKFDTLEIAADSGQFKAVIAAPPNDCPARLVDSLVRVRGVCASHFNRQRQLFDVRLLIAQPGDLQVLRPGAAEPFAIPERSLEQLMQFTPHGPFGHRVKVRGVVSYSRGDEIYLQSGQNGVQVETARTESLEPGKVVEAVGFPAKGDYTPMLQNAMIQTVGEEPAPGPEPVTADEALKGVYDCRLVRLEATLLEPARQSQQQFMILQSGGFIFRACLDSPNQGENLADLPHNSRVAVTGVCRIDPGSVWLPAKDWRATSFRLLLRSPADVVVLAAPPWWTVQKLMLAASLFGMVGFGALAWVGILRRRVHRQTAIIRRQLEAEAALKERYENLFENASDVVFTHDLTGRLTSINRVGEQLLQRGREEMLCRNLTEFVAEEQRAAVALWLAQVARGPEPASVEWDFINADGQRLRLEIHARVIEQAGREPEVESVARDITERKGLEREILEISNREQRRIGHDLHDGVCQQLAAIAYRMDILGDQLQEKGVAESTEAERIGALVQEAMQQTRGVARGLFPVRLDESGLVSALAEFAETTSHLFRLQCQFRGDELVRALDKVVSLHLYYIVQESVSNAIKHGQATRVTVDLAESRDRLVLTIEDNGKGFQPPAAGATGMGIRIMRYRARMIGAALELNSQPGAGTQITCALYMAA